MSEQQRLLLAIALSFGIIMVWQILFVDPLQQAQQAEIKETSQTPITALPEDLQLQPRQYVVDRGFTDKTRVAISTPSLSGSLNLLGARIDDLTLLDYKTEIGEDKPDVILFSPSNTPDRYFAAFGWLGNGITMPNLETLWSTDSDKLTPQTPVTLYWNNPEGVRFEIVIAIDENYMFSIKRSVYNTSGNDISFKEYSLLNRIHENDEGSNNMIIHEGALSVLDDSLSESTFEDMLSQQKVTHKDKKGWIGFSDKYWLTALIPQKNDRFVADFIGMEQAHGDVRYQVDLSFDQVLLTNGATHSSELKMFAGAKKLALLDQYQQQYEIALFDRAVDFGVLYFITRPIFIVLSYFYQVIGNFGIAILLLTVLIKGLLFPLAYKGFRGMNRLKDLQPQMTALKEKHKDDAMAFQKAVMDLYKKKNVNPLAGCLPILLQMPVFFALYKVLYVSIEMRHAPFFGWIQDLSAPDSTTIFNLFGLIAWNPPLFLQIGVFPLLMALTMYIQQRLSPEPTDPMQAKMMRFMPLIFLFMFASFPAGLTIYWAWSNILSIIQQTVIKWMDAKR